MQGGSVQAKRKIGELGRKLISVHVDFQWKVPPPVQALTFRRSWILSHHLSRHHQDGQGHWTVSHLGNLSLGLLSGQVAACTREVRGECFQVFICLIGIHSDSVWLGIFVWTGKSSCSLTSCYADKPSQAVGREKHGVIQLGGSTPTQTLPCMPGAGVC